MSILPADSPHVVIIGGGIAGLTAAWYLHRGAHCTVLEASDRWGGKVETQRLTVPGGEVLAESAPDGFITRKPWALDLIRTLDLDSELIPVNSLPERIYVLRKGELVPLPEGLSLLVPTKIGAFLRSPLFSPLGKLRILLDWLIPRRKQATDESIGSFVRRRLGSEALERLAEPMLCGVYNGDAEKLSLLATFPNFAMLERAHGSLIRGMQRQRQMNNEHSTSPLVSMRGGMQQLVDALVDQIECDMFLNTRVKSISPEVEGGYNIILDDDTLIHADFVIPATPAHVTAALLQDCAPESTKYLRQIQFESVGSVSLAYQRADVPHALDAFGVVIPGIEKRRIDGITFTSSKWQARAPQDVCVLRVFFGGPNTREMMLKDDEDLVTIVRDELHELLGISATPLSHSLARWPQAYPQYEVGHLNLVAKIEQTLPFGIRITGSSYLGIGLPDCIHHAKQVAQQVMAELDAGHKVTDA